MLDTFDIDYTKCDAKIFTNIGDSSNWQVWQKPRNAKMVHFFVLGGGSGGGGGFSGSTGSGGGGGGSGAIVNFLIPAFFVPDNLYVLAGNGGAGGAAGIAGSSASNSYVSLVNGSTTAANLYLKSGTVAATGGGAGNTGAGGTLGAAETTATSSIAILTGMGLWFAIAGQVGTAGGLAGPGTNNTMLSLTVVCGGTGGGGFSPSAGGNINSNGFVSVTISGGIPGNNNGGTGLSLQKPFMTTGGAGGGGNTAGNGGGGGQAGFGSGGGGGGTGSGTGGTGGNGGSGMVIITSW